MTAAGVFYPSEAGTAEERLQFYASRFPVVEVDATYYALPSRRLSELWVERTPPDFVFDIKAHALLTGQPTETKRLPKALREALPPTLAEKARLYAKDLPGELYAEVWRQFADGLAPLAEHGQLGAVFLQYPKWFFTSSENRDAIREAKARARAVRAAGRGGVPERDLVQREERRAHPPVPRGRGHPAGDGRRAAGLQVVDAARRGDHREGPGGRPLPRPPDRDLGGHEGTGDRRAVPVPVRRGRARGVGPADRAGRGPGRGHPRPDEQLLRELRLDQRPRARGDAGARARRPTRADGPARSGEGTRWRPRRSRASCPAPTGSGSPTRGRPGPRSGSGRSTRAGPASATRRRGCAAGW